MIRFLNLVLPSPPICSVLEKSTNQEYLYRGHPICTFKHFRKLGTHKPNRKLGAAEKNILKLQPAKNSLLILHNLLRIAASYTTM